MNQMGYAYPPPPWQSPPQTQLPPGAPGGIVLPGGSADNPLAIGVMSDPPVVTLPLSHARQVSVHNLDRARQTVTPVTVVAEVDAAHLKALHDRSKPQFEATTGVPLTYLPFFARATVKALQAFPIMNSVLTPQGFVIPRQINLGVATAVPGAVLIPTVLNAERLSIAELARDLYSKTQRAKANQLPTGEMAGQTFVISNTGRYGKTLFGTPVILPPNVGILAFEAIVKRPVVDEHDQVVARPMMYLALTADHRAVDGAEMIGFLSKVKDVLESLQF